MAQALQLRERERDGGREREYVRERIGEREKERGRGEKKKADKIIISHFVSAAHRRAMAQKMQLKLN